MKWNEDNLLKRSHEKEIPGKERIMFESIFGRMLCIPCRQVYVLPSYFFSFLFVCPYTKTLLQTSSSVSLCLLIDLFVYVFYFTSLSSLSICTVCISVYRYICLSVCQNVISFFKDQQIRDDISIRKDLTRSGMSSVYFKCVNSTLQARKSQVSMHI